MNERGEPATALPLVVAVTQIGLDEGRLLRENAAALVGAGMVSVLVFPIVALQPRGRRGAARRRGNDAGRLLARPSASRVDERRSRG